MSKYGKNKKYVIRNLNLLLFYIIFIKIFKPIKVIITFHFKEIEGMIISFLIIICISSVNELLKIKDELTKERDEKLSEVTKLREELANATAKQQKAEQDREEAEMKIAEVRTYHAACLQLFVHHCMR